MNAIVAVDSRFGIGRDGGMLFHLREDLQYFKRMTLGKTLVMGRATLESLPGGKPLPGRDSLVLSRKADYEVEGAKVVHSLTELAQALQNLPEDEVMLIGGGQLYGDLIDCCEKAFVTHIRHNTEADTFFPDLLKKKNWELETCEEEREENGLRFAFCRYINHAVVPLSKLAREEEMMMRRKNEQT